MVVGCDGVNSVVANFLSLGGMKRSSLCVVRGFTNYEDGHGLENEFTVLSKEQVQLGKTPMNDNLVYWFVTRKYTSQGTDVARRTKLSSSIQMKL